MIGHLFDPPQNCGQPSPGYSVRLSERALWPQSQADGRREMPGPCLHTLSFSTSPRSGLAKTYKYVCSNWKVHGVGHVSIMLLTAQTSPSSLCVVDVADPALHPAGARKRSSPASRPRAPPRPTKLSSSSRRSLHVPARTRSPTATVMFLVAAAMIQTPSSSLVRAKG